MATSKQIEIDDLPEEVGGRRAAYIDLETKGTLQEMEYGLIQATLMKNNWKLGKTAEELGIHKTTLWRKMKKLGLKVVHESENNS